MGEVLDRAGDVLFNEPDDALGHVCPLGLFYEIEFIARRRIHSPVNVGNAGNILEFFRVVNPWAVFRFTFW